MREHRVEFHVDAPRKKVWRLLHPAPPPDAPSPRVIKYEHGQIDIIQEGDERGQGLVRTCTFRVPKYLLSGGLGRSFECVVEIRPNEYAKYVAMGRPLWSRAEGQQIYEDADGGGTKLTFIESYDCFNPFFRRTIEGFVHRRISADNDAYFAKILGYAGKVTKLRSF